MRNIFLISIVLFIFIFGMSFVSAKEDTHFEIDKDQSGYSAIITLKDSSNNPIPKVKFSISITKPNGAVRTLPTKTLNKTGQNIFFLGTTNGNYVITVNFKGNDVVYTYDLSSINNVTEEVIKSDMMKEQLASALDSTADTFVGLCKQLEEESKIEGIQIIVNYTYGDEVIVTKTFNSSGAVE